MAGRPERVDVVVVGAGQAGLATSFELSRAGVEHVVLERGRVGETWRGRWDSFCLVTPNWTVQLPGGAYDGDDPDGFMLRDEIVSFLERYASSFTAPVRSGVTVTSLRSAPSGGFVLETADGAEIRGGSVVVATGAYQRPHRPAAAAGLPDALHTLDADDYGNERELPEGAVLVVGSGQTGCQLAEELSEAGREVFLSCGRAPWLPRRFGDRDLIWWAVETGFMDVPVEALPNRGARLAANVLATGRDGGHDLHLRTLRDAGVTLLGHFAGAGDGRARFAPDLAESVAWGDDRYREFRQLVAGVVRDRGLPDPQLPDPPPFDARAAPESIELARLGAVVFTGGFAPTTAAGSTYPARSTTSGSRCTPTARALPRPASTSSASTSFASGSRRSSTASARTLPSSPPRSRPTRIPTVASFLHTMVRITDPAKSRAFYEALGFSFARDMDIVRDGAVEATNYFFSIGDDDNVLELTFNHDGRTYDLGTGYGHIALSVDDLDEALAELAGQGIEPEREPYRVREGGSRLCFVRDPDGYRIELIDSSGK
jgi:putative flavoprotein involved in K+ transport